MSEYRIMASEVIYYTTIIEANTEEEAIKKFNDKSVEEFQDMVSDTEGYKIISIENLEGANV